MLGRTAVAAVLMALLAGCPATTDQGGTTSGGGGGGGGGTGGTAMTADQMQEVERTLSGVGKDAIIRCFSDEMERQKNKTLTGRIMIKLLIGTTGAADQVTLGECTIRSTEFQACVIEAVKGLEFPMIRTATPYTRAYDLSPAY